MNIQALIDRFLVSYVTNDMETCSKCLSDSISINYSNIGSKTGKSRVTDALKWDQKFNVCHVMTTNALYYHTDSQIITCLMAHHMVSYEKNNEMFPFIFGGKYMFFVNTEEKLIEKILYVQEYQGENTVFMKEKWIFTQSNADYSIFEAFDFNKLYTHIIWPDDKKEKAKQKSSLFFWMLDIGNIREILPLISDNFSISRDPYVGNRPFTATKATLESFIQTTKAYYNQNQYSICFNDVCEDGHDIIIYASHLTPHRLGTKKRNYLTKYHTFFDEDVMIRINADEKIQTVICAKSADVHYNGFKILSY